MSISYTRISNINEKVKDVSLTISQWRVLFAVNENTYIEEIGDYVEESIDQIQESVDALVTEGLLISSAAAAPVEPKPTQEVAQKEEPAEEIVEDVFDDIVIDEEEEISIDDSEPEIVFADEDDNDIEIDIEDEIELIEDEPDVVEEIVEDLVIEEEVVEAEPEPVKEEIVEETVPEEAPVSSGDSKKIMVVDESIVIRKMVEIAFEDLNFTIVGYSSGEDALANADAESADLYLVDSALKDMKSITLMNQLKEKTSSPVLMFCTKTNPQLGKEVEAAGCNGLVSKPFNDDDLLKKVNDLI